MTSTRSHRIAAALAACTVLAAAGALAAGPAHAARGDDMRSRIDAAAAASRTSTARKVPDARAKALAEAQRAGPVAPPTGPVRLVVGYQPGTSPATMARHLRGAGLRAQGAATGDAAGDAALAKVGARVVNVPRADEARVVAELRSDPSVRYVERDGLSQAAAVVPNDPFYTEQAELPQITVPDAWSVTTGSASVTVAVVDTGVSPVRDLAGAVLPGRDFVNNDADAADDSGHGTSVASLIAGRGNNGAGIAGVCWACKILPVKVARSDGNADDSVIAAGVVYAADKGAKIINIAFSSVNANRALQDAVTYAQRKGALVIASAGNGLSRTPRFPAVFPGVLAVGGTNELSEPYFYCFFGICGGTNYGSDWVDVAAPYCTTAMSIDPDDDEYDLFCGTSASVSLVSGAAALLKSQYPAASAAALAHSLTRTARPTTITDFTAYGEIRAGASIRSVDASVPRITGATPGQNKRFRGTVTVGATGVSDVGTGLSHADLYANGKYIGRDTTVPYAVKYASGKTNGTVKLQWRVYDKAGNVATFDRNLIADNKAPTAKITGGPKNGAKVKGTVTLKASAGDASGINRVELLINGKVVAKDTTAAYSFKIKVSRYAKTMKIQVRAVDKVGNTATSASRTWKR